MLLDDHCIIIILTPQVKNLVSGVRAGDENEWVLKTMRLSEHNFVISARIELKNTWLESSLQAAEGI